MAGSSLSSLSLSFLFLTAREARALSDRDREGRERAKKAGRKGVFFLFLGQ